MNGHYHSKTTKTKAGKGWGGRGGGSSGAEWGREGVGQSLEYDFITLIPLNNTTKPKAGKEWGERGDRSVGGWGGWGSGQPKLTGRQSVTDVGPRGAEWGREGVGQALEFE